VLSPTEEILEIANNSSGRFIPFCNIDPRADTNSPEADLVRMLRYYIEQGCKGLGEITANLPFDDPRVENLFAACQECEMSVTFHIGPQIGGCYGLFDEPGLPRLERALQRFPGLKFLGHSQPFWAEVAPSYGQVQSSLPVTRTSTAISLQVVATMRSAAIRNGGTALWRTIKIGFSLPRTSARRAMTRRSCDT